MGSSNEAAPMLESEQERLLDAAIRVVKAESFEMKRSLDRNELMEGLRHASMMIAELRTGTLTPKFYYRLYVDVINELRHLSTSLQDTYLGTNSSQSEQEADAPVSNGSSSSSVVEENRRVAELYETVQYTGNIIPRLYLLVTIGVIYIKSGEAPVIDILRDLVEMCRGVQHPLRGLFLRNYLITSTKELIPDGPEQQGASGVATQVDDSIDFIMANFSEMNKLWVRMQHQGPSREREKRERERRELRILVGTNLVRLSQLEHLNLEVYRRAVLPGILEQSVSCREPISQEYLMECVVQVFPDYYHLATLHEFLDACAELHQEVHIKNVIGTLIDHLAQYVQSDEGKANIPEGVELFEIFHQHAEQVVGSRQQMPTEDVISIQIAVLNMALQCYRERQDYANTVYAATANVFKKMAITSIPFNSVIGRELVKLLKAPVDAYKNIIELLPLDAYGTVLAFLDYKGRTHMASYLISDALENGTRVEEEAHVDGIFALIESLLVDQFDDPQLKGAAGEEGDDRSRDEDFEDEQCLVAKFIHLVYSEDEPEQTFRLLGHVRKTLGKGGKWRLRYTLPALIFATLRLLQRYARESSGEVGEDSHAKIGKIFHFAMNTINALKMQAERPELALCLNLKSALASDAIPWAQSAEVTYEFVSKAFSIYEEDISESREQVHSLTSLIGTVERLNRLAEENHEPLRNQCALYAAKLLKKPDQARMVCLVARLFWHGRTSDTAPDGLRDGSRVAECLKKAVKIASQCMEDIVQITLYIHILSNYLHFYEGGCEEISVESVNQLIEKIRELLLQMDPSPEADQLNTIFKLLLQRVRTMREDPPEGCRLPFDGFAA